MSDTPLQIKMRAAYIKSRQYHDMLALCFPNPSSHRRASHGGPPICAMHFGRALRQMGGYSVGMGSQRMVTIPSRVTQSRKERHPAAQCDHVTLHASGYRKCPNCDDNL